MIIYGFRAIRWTGGEGTFFCPQCQATSPYRDRNVRLWFTLYFIPVIPLWSVGRVIACGTCKTEWDPGVMSYDPAAEAAQAQHNYFTFLMRVMVLMAVMDGDLDDAEIEIIGTLLTEAGMEADHRPSPGALREEASLAKDAGITVSSFLEPLAGELPDEIKTTLLAAAYEVMMASPEPRKQQQLSEAAGTLGVTPEDLLKVMNDVEEKRDQQAAMLETLRRS